MAVSKNGRILAVSNEDGWTAVELFGREGEISKGDTIFARDWEAEGREDLIFKDEVFSADFRGCGSREQGAWAIRQIDQFKTPGDLRSWLQSNPGPSSEAIGTRVFSLPTN